MEMKSDIGLEILLSLDGTEYTEENGYWFKIEAIKDKGVPYEFKNAEQLLNDFLKEVNAILSKLDNGSD